MQYANVLGRLGRAADARAAVDKCADQNPLMDASYYAALMAVLSDQPAVVERRTSGLRQAGLLRADAALAASTAQR